MPMSVSHNSRHPPVLYEVVQLKQGWDITSPTLEIGPGVVRDSKNFEITTTGGYGRIAGYERYDGRPAPSAASYAIVQVSSFTNVPSVGQTLTGNTTGATSVILSVVQGSAAYMVVTKVAGAYNGTEVVKVGATTIGTQTAQTAIITSLLNAQYLALAADNYRADIAAVPGSGPVRGVATLTVGGVDNTYAFRDDAGGTTTLLYKSSGAGWVNVPFNEEVSFSNIAAGGIVDGATLTQGGVTATIKRVMLQTGSIASGVNTGRFIISGRAGGNFAAGAATGTGGIAVTLGGVQTAITMTVGGHFEFVTGNFFGQAGTLRLYGCDGVNRMFEFDGTTLCPITTGTAIDAPKHLIIYAKHLVGAFASSWIGSGTATPYNWSASAGAAEIATGDTITGFLLSPGSQTTSSMIIYGLQTTFVLYGTDIASYNLTVYKYGSGGLHYTGQNLLNSYVLDAPGITSLQTTLAYGNFAQASLTVNIFPFIEAERAKSQCSGLCRAKSQYRLYFSDGLALFTTIINGKDIGSMQIQYPDIPFCTSNSDTLRSTGNEEIYFGATTGGFVMQQERGSSFDGANLDAYLTLNWNNVHSPRMLKRFRRLSVETQGNFYAAFSVGYLLGYGSQNIMQASPISYASNFVLPPAWDAFVWDQFTWDGSTLQPTEVELTGTGENIQFSFTTTTNYIYAFSINSLIVHYSMRRGVR